MYQFQSSSTHLRSLFRDDILSLLGNAGKTLFTSVPVETHFSLGFFFGESLRKAYTKVKTLPYVKPLVYALAAISAVLIAPTESSFAAEAPVWKTFIATAYYSPLPGQQYYYRGTYEAEIKLNGEGAVGASGAPVFTGMLAAPKSYAFGTQIFFEWLWLGIVQDRGGAITTTSDGDRIDIWMGYGDAWLKRTLAWGRRKIQGTIITDGKERPMMDISGIDNGSIDLSRFSATKATANGGLSADVMQMFADLWYTPKDNNVWNMIAQFQMDRKIINSLSDDGAGNYGPKTTAALTAAYAEFKKLQTEEFALIEAAKKKLGIADSEWQKRYTEAEAQVQAFGQPKLYDTGEQVKLLQTFLTKSGHYTAEVDGQMDISMLAAIRKYQRSRTLLASGKLDAPTQYAMIDDIIGKK